MRHFLYSISLKGNQMLSNNAQKLLNQRYFRKGETWDDLVTRVIQHTCGRDDFAHNMYELVHDRVFLPNSPALVNAGTQNGGLFACFIVGPIHDNLEDHFSTVSTLASIAKYGGGAGFSGTVLRPKNSQVAGSSHGYSYGPNDFAELVSHAMDMMTQSGFRKMALMYTLDIEHPDIHEFIHLKQNRPETELYNFNQSVMASDSFMHTAFNEKDSSEHDLLSEIAYNAWKNGEPGLLFKTTINTNTPYQDEIFATNP